ncbi:MAG: ferredoxin [Gammaproteobacteria bacterium]|mgnify:CR=1 FL=1|jgi:hypothetical protein|nr:ferredoxin [Gammaproteobacteria bacterium]
MPDIHNSLTQYGLRVLSWQPTPVDLHAQYPWAQSLLMAGQGGQGYWPILSQSPEFNDQAKDPIDRWSQRIGEQLAEQFYGLALYPFTGPPYWPFLSWAQQAGDTVPSRLGMHLHHVYGLWHSYRFALLLPTGVPTAVAQPNQAHQSPCPSCLQPCLATCPVNAFVEEGKYLVDQCRAYVSSNPQSPCFTQGCQSRLACPEGQGSHEQAQHQYHMRIFAKAIG